MGWLPFDPKYPTLVLFVVAYVLIVLFYHRKGLVAWCAVAVLLAAGMISPRAALQSVEWSVILLYLGMLFVSDAFLSSRMPDHLATILASRTRSAGAAMLVICIFTGLLSMALENVAVVLLIAPVALSIARSCRVSPVPLFIGMAISSNLQGAATLIGDPPSMLLASYSGMSFNDFFMYHGRPSIFFAVQVGALISWAVLAFLYRRHRNPMPPITIVPFTSLIPTLLVAGLVVALIFVSALFRGAPLATGITCCAVGVASLAWRIIHARASDPARPPALPLLVETVKRQDLATAGFLIGIFILVGSVSATGILGDLSRLLLRVSGGNALVVFLLVVWGAVLLSAFVDNVPFLVAMLPVVSMAAKDLGIDPAPLFFGLLVGASIGGNITPVGASANIVAMGIVRNEGHQVGFFEFVKIGLPFTVAAVVGASAFIWLAAA